MHAALREARESLNTVTGLLGHSVARYNDARLLQITRPSVTNGEAETAAREEVRTLTDDESRLLSNIQLLEDSIENANVERQADDNRAAEDAKRYALAVADERIADVQARFRDALVELRHVASLRAPGACIDLDGLRRAHAPEHELHAYAPLGAARYRMPPVGAELTPDEEFAA